MRKIPPALPEKGLLIMFDAGKRTLKREYADQFTWHDEMISTL
jgi:hypothetical protein